MDGVHEAHLSRILEARRRRGVLGVYAEPAAAAPPPRGSAASVMSPRPPSPPAHRRASSATGTQTAPTRTVSAGAQTWSTPFSAPPSSAANATGAGGAERFGWRPGAARGGGGGDNERAAAAASSPNPLLANAVWDGGVRFQSPGRVPSLAYSTPNSASRRRHSPWRSAPTAPTPTWAAGAADVESGERLWHARAPSVEPLPAPLFVPRPRSSPREPLWGPSTGTSSSFAAPRWSNASGGSSFSPRPLTTTWRSRSPRYMPTTAAAASPSFTWPHPAAPLSTTFSRWGSGGGSAAPLMAWPTRRTSPRGAAVQDSRYRHESASSRPRHRSRRHYHQSSGSRGHVSRSRNGRRGNEDDGEDGEGEEGDDAYRAAAPRRGDARQRHRSSSSRHNGRGAGAPARGPSYAPPVVYMGPTSAASSREGSPSRHHGSSALGAARFGDAMAPPHAPPPVERKFALGLPDARSTMDLRTSIETLRAGDWFYKWTAKGDSVHRRWVWVDTKSYLLVWSNHETHSTHFCGNVRLDHICQVTSRNLASVDEDGFPKTYYVLLIETTKRVLQLATELQDKCDAWFEALNNVMGFIHRNDMAKGALIPD